jgi:RHS repeat-associated protein
LTEQTDANNTVTTLKYDNLGRLIQQDVGAQHTTWEYDKPGYYGMLITETRNNGFKRVYKYDDNQRLYRTQTHIDNYTFEHYIIYDANYNRKKAEMYPGGEVLQTGYNNWGYPNKNTRLKDNNIVREVQSMSAQGEIVDQLFGNGLIQHFKRHIQSGWVDEVCTTGYLTLNCDDSAAQYIDYDYNAFGNLNHQDNRRMGLEYEYGYDVLHRLDDATLSFKGTLQNTIDYDYDTSGNILNKTDYANDYLYGDNTRSQGGNAGPNAVRQITKRNNSDVHFSYDNNGNMLAGDGRTITYNSANKPINIIKGSITSHFEYGSDEQRFKQVIDEGNNEITIYYVGKSFEKRIKKTNGSVASEIDKTYLGGFAVLTTTHTGISNDPALVYLSADRLGSITTVTDGTNALGNLSIDELIVQQRSYGPFGQVRDINGNTNLNAHLGTTRGFTGHEQLQEVELIHMNGRAFDYQLGRFLSVDPFVQFPSNTQSANPYSYILNNPLSAKDPSGYLVDTKEQARKIAGVVKVKRAVLGSRIKRTTEYVVTGSVEITGSGKQSVGVVTLTSATPIGDVGKAGVGGGSVGGNAQKEYSVFRGCEPRYGGCEMAYKGQMGGAGAWKFSLKGLGARFKSLFATKGLVGQIGRSHDAQRALLRQAMGSNGSGKVAHHVIPLEALKRFPELMKKAAQGGFNLNGRNNGALLNRVDHIGGHPIYNSAVMEQLNRINPNLSPTRIAREIQKASDTLQNAIKNGTFGPWG